MCIRDRRRDDPAFVAEVPERSAELERIARRAPGACLAVGDQARECLVQLFGEKRRPKLNDALDALADESPAATVLASEDAQHAITAE